jgi:mono/diheme cytochrome c family protein
VKPQSNVWVTVKILLLVLGATALYTHIGQLVPQKEVHPPTKIVVDQDATPEELAEYGKAIAEGSGLCLTCHTIGKSGPGLRYPDLGGIATRAETRIEGMAPLTYLAKSIYDPESFIVPGFAGGMPTINEPPIGLDDEEMLQVIAYLQSLGGTPTVTLQTTKAELGIE